MNPPTESGPTLHTLPVVRKVHYGRMLAAVIILALLAGLVSILATNPNMQWGVAWKYVASRELINGLLITLQLTVFSMVVGIVLGTALALMRLSSNPVVYGVAGLYIWLFRGTPLIVQIILWFNVSLIFPNLSIGIPFGGPTFFSESTNSLVTPLVAALLALSLNEAAYMSEIVRAGIASVAPGQLEAAQTIGLTRRSAVQRIVLPQAMRVIIPPTGNQVIGMLKGTALVSVIAVADLLYSAQLVYSRTYETIPLLIAASIWYLIASTVLTYIQGHIERYYGKGTSAPTPGMIQQFGSWWSGRGSRKPAANAVSELELNMEGDAR